MIVMVLDLVSHKKLLGKMMNTGDEGVTEFISTEVEAKNNAHFPFSEEANASNAEHEVKSTNKTNSRMTESLSEQLREERKHISITSLPQELIAMIFSHIDAHFLSTTVPRVCRYFHNVLKSEGFWKGRKTLYINEEESGIDFIMTVIPKCPNIRHLNVNFYYHGPETSLTISNMNFPYLRSLVMNNVDSRAENPIEMIVQGAPHLRVIKLRGETTKKMLEVLEPATELTTFFVHGKNEHYVECEIMLTNVFKRCSKLETVNVQLGRFLPGGPLLTLLEVCSGTLKRLSWKGEFSDIALKKLSTCPQISQWDILGTGITDESVKFVRNMKKIETLRLYSFCLYDDTVSFTSGNFIKMCKEDDFPHLKHLNIDDCEELDDTMLKKIAPNMKDLESLELTNTNVTDVGIGFVLAHCSNLRALRLGPNKYRNGISFSFVKDLPICCPRLHFLGLFNKTVPQPIIDEFLNTHPSYNFKICEELTDLDFLELLTIDLKDIGLNPMIIYRGDDDDHIIGHK